MDDSLIIWEGRGLLDEISLLEAWRDQAVLELQRRDEIEDAMALAMGEALVALEESNIWSAKEILRTAMEAAGR